MNISVFGAGEVGTAVAAKFKSLGHDVVDLGDLSACRAMESLAPMWIRLNDRLGHVWFNLAVVRKDG